MRPLTMRFDNRVELMNEFFVSVCSIQMMFFTDAIHEQETQYIYGWSLVYTVSLLCFLNLTIVIRMSAWQTFLLAVRQFRRCKNSFKTNTKDTDVFDEIS